MEIEIFSRFLLRALLALNIACLSEGVSLLISTFPTELVGSTPLFNRALYSFSSCATSVLSSSNFVLCSLSSGVSVIFTTAPSLCASPSSGSPGSLPLMRDHTPTPNFLTASPPCRAPSQSTVPSSLKYTAGSRTSSSSSGTSTAALSELPDPPFPPSPVIPCSAISALAVSPLIAEVSLRDNILSSSSSQTTLPIPEKDDMATSHRSSGPEHISSSLFFNFSSSAE
mmetsp:Transcript_22890/g.47485  ORF Transcript_22890/g.47485 Transcript_22890/m.47485 type:complete len:227 (-) Transcript_22890:481-1161(-)